MSRKRLILLSLLSVPLLVLLAAGGLLFGATQTEFGRDVLRQQIEALVSAEDGVELSVGKIDGNLLSNFRISRIAVADTEGDWLIAKELEVFWEPVELLNRRLSIGGIKLETLEILRAPLSPSASDDAGGDAIPALPLDIALGSLEILRIKLHEALAGQEAVFRLGMSLNATGEDSIRSKVDLQQLEGGQAFMTGLVEFHPANETLGVDIALSEPENGLVARTLDLPGAPAVELSILGDGAITAWQGQILAKAGDLLDADLIVSTALNESPENREVKIDLQGKSRFTALLPAQILPLFEPHLDIDSTLVWSEKNGDVTLTSATLQSDALRMNAEGRFGLADEALAAKITLTPLDTALLKPLIAPAEFDSGQLDITASGNLQALDTDITLLLEGLLVSPDISLQALTGRFQTAISPDQTEQLSLKGQTRLEGIAGLPPEATAILGQQVDLDFELQLDLPDKRLSVSEVKASGTGFSLSGSGRLGLETQAADAALAILLTDLSLLSPALGRPISGRLKINADLETPNFEQQTAIGIRAVTEQLDPGDARLKALIGETVEMQAAIDATPASIAVRSLDLKTAFATMTASAELPTTFEKVEADFEANVDDLSPLRDMAGTTLAGSAKLSGKLKGTPDDPAVVGKLTIDGLKLDGMELGSLNSDYDVQALVSGPKGTLQSQLQHPEAAADLTTSFTLTTPDRLDLTDLSLKLADAQLGGNLTVPLDGMPVTGQLDGQVPNLAALARLAGQPADGSLTFTANLIANGESQDAQLTIDAAGLRADRQDPDGPTLETLKAAITGRDLLRTPSVEASAEAAGLRAGALSLDSVDLEAQGTDEAATFKFGVRNASGPALTFDGSGNLRLEPESMMLALSSFNGSYEDRPVQLLQPLVLQQKAAQTRVEDFKLRLDGGEITGSATLNEASASAGLTLKALPLDLLTLLDPNLASSGTLDGQADFSVAQGKAAGRFQFDATGAKPTNEDFTKLPALNGSLSGELANERLTFAGQIEGLEETAVDANGSLPFEVALDPFAVKIPENGPLEANAKLRGDLAKLWPLLAIDEHLLAGKLAADVQASGSLSAPKVAGTASVEEGRYENLELGTLLTDMQLSMTLDDTDRIGLSLTARDGDDGTLAADGEIDLQTAGPEPLIDLSTKLTKTRLLRRDDISAQASGDIQISGMPSSMAVTGKIVTDLIEINIGGALPASIVDLPVEERNRPGTSEANGNGNGEESAPGTMTSLDLSLSMPRRVFIRGRGLDSEWSGRFKVTGTAEAPLVEGELSPVRGDFSFAGKSFALQKGKVSLAGGKETDPDLDLSAVYDANGFKAIVAITGTASSPEIGLSSEPELPQDEILAQVLFGKSTGQLSPVEALQLAEAVASVSGKLGSGEGILGLVRNTIGVDVLTAGTNENSGEVEVRAGKYLTEDVYVGVSQGTDPTSTKVTVEVEVTPNISVESDVGQDASGRVGVFWKFDY